MARSEAARSIDPELFRRGWSRIGGSAGGIGKRGQMLRAARGHSPAIFKAIRQGGCHTGAQLRAQLNYLTTKSSFILDSRGTHDGKKILSPGEIARVSRRFENQWNERHHPKLGQTSHLMMAFPIGTKVSDVREITGEICERFFQGEGAQFDYIAAIHEDRAHPHAHIIVNRRSQDGEMFFLGKEHHFSYQAFREAMVEAAARHGLRLEATERLDRGVLTRRPETEEIRKAQAEGRAPVERQRRGTDLERAVAAVARRSSTYHGLAAEASRENFEDVAAALARAGEVLGQGGRIEADGVLYMAEQETQFDELLDRFSQNIRQIEAVIDEAPASERPVIERKLSEVLRDVSRLRPLGDRSEDLHTSPSREGIYAAPNLVEAYRGELADPELRAGVTEAVSGSGIDAEAVLARIGEGAANAALEQEWLAQDLRAIAKEARFDLQDPAGLDQALDRLEAVHRKLGDVLTEARVLRPVEELNLQEVDSDAGGHFSDRLSDRAESETEALLAQINERLTPDEIAALRKGEAGALEGIIDQPLQQLVLARAWLEANNVQATDPAMERVLDRIVELRHGDVLKQAERDGEKGLTHG